jgi:hypothetical protein
MKKIIIIGGGFYGAYLAAFLGKNGNEVLIIEKENEILTKASSNNQTRVHNGYHYPRCSTTGLRSSILFPKFVEEFKSSIEDDFDKYYAIAKFSSKINSEAFESYCKKINVPLSPASTQIKSYFNNELVEKVYKAKEFTYNINMLRKTMMEKLVKTRVSIKCNEEVSSVKSINEMMRVFTENGNSFYDADEVYNCTYANINSILKSSNIPTIDLEHEYTEMCLYTPPSDFSKIGITIMDGPFFSTLPSNQIEKAHIVHHVKYTPRLRWQEELNKADEINEIKKTSNWEMIKEDITRYIPALESSQFVKSIWQQKTILPNMDENDSRPILFKKDYHFKGLHCVLGSKISSVYDLVDKVVGR